MSAYRLSQEMGSIGVSKGDSIPFIKILLTMTENIKYANWHTIASYPFTCFCGLPQSKFVTSFIAYVCKIHSKTLRQSRISIRSRYIELHRAFLHLEMPGDLHKLCQEQLKSYSPSIFFSFCLNYRSRKKSWPGPELLGKFHEVCH